MVVNFSTATEFCGPSILSREPSSAQDSSVQDPKTARKEISISPKYKCQQYSPTFRLQTC